MLGHWYPGPRGLSRKFSMLVREQGVKRNQQGHFAEYRMATKCWMTLKFSD